MTDNICKTAGCFAGWRALLDGYTFNHGRTTWKQPTLINVDNGKCLGGANTSPSIGRYAAETLELTTEEADALFYDQNTLSDLKHMVDELCAQEDRSEKSKRLLHETMDAVLDADALGLWDQTEWVRVLEDEEE